MVDFAAHGGDPPGWPPAQRSRSAATAVRSAGLVRRCGLLNHTGRRVAQLGHHFAVRGTTWGAVRYISRPRPLIVLQCADGAVDRIKVREPPRCGRSDPRGEQPKDLYLLRFRRAKRPERLLPTERMPRLCAELAIPRSRIVSDGSTQPTAKLDMEDAGAMATKPDDVNEVRTKSPHGPAWVVETEVGKSRADDPRDQPLHFSP